jgi:hypothetical protein
MAAPTLLEIDDTQETLTISSDSRDASAIQGRSIETGTPADGELLVYSSSGSEWIYKTVDENIDDRVAALIQNSATGGLTWTYDDSAGTLTPVNSLVNADINASAAIAVSKLASSSVSYGGVSVTLGTADATPAFNLSDATAYPGDSSLVTTGALNSGSVTSGFGTINIGSSALTAGAGSFTTLGATDDVTLAATKKLYLDGGNNTSIRESAADTIMFTTGGTDRWKVNADGHLLAEGDNNYDIGGSGANRPRDVYIAGTTTGGPASFTTISGSTSLALATGATVTGIDNGDLATGSATLLATQGAIKTYVDAQVTAQDLDVISDSGNIDIDLDSESLTLTGGTGIDTSATGTTVTYAIDSTVATLAGSQTLTNKTISGSSNTLSNIANGSLTNSSVNYGGVTLSLGGSDTTPAFNLSDATAYTGDSSLVTVGTITSGTWQGSQISGDYIDVTTSPLANTKIWIGDSSGDAQEFALSGDATMTAGGVVTVSSAAACTGNAASATALQTARTIGGTSFDGTANIVPSTITVTTTTDTGCSVALLTSATGDLQPKTDAGLTYNATSNVLSGTFSGDITGDVTGNVSGSSGSTTGNAATATALATARTIGGTSFDGTANIVPATITVAATTDATCSVALFESATGDLAPKTDAGLTYNATSNVLAGTFSGDITGDITGNADTATALETARTINDTSFDGTANITVTAAAGTLTGATLNSGVTASSLTSVGTIATGVWDAGAVTSSSTVTADTDVIIGTNPSSTGDIRLNKDFGIFTRNNANDANKAIVSENVVTGNDTLDFGDNTKWSALRFHCSTANVMELTSTAINLNKAVTLTGDLTLAATNKIYLDGGTHTYIVEPSADRIELVAGGNTAAKFGVGTANSLGGGTSGWAGLKVATTFTSDGSDSVAHGAYFGGAITGAAGDTSYMSGVFFDSQVITQTATESIGLISQVRIAEPNITDNLTGDITTACSLYIHAAPTEGETNAALYVNAGTSYFGGNVGIGTTSPSTNLYVEGGSSLSHIRTHSTVTQGDGTVFGKISMQGDNSEEASIRGFYDHATSAYSGMSFYTDGAAGTVHAMTIDSSQNVGIGTTSPNNTLDVNGGIVCSPNTDGKDTFELSTHSSDEGRLRIKNVDTTTVEIRAGGDSYFNGGNIGIGITSPTELLHVRELTANKDGILVDGYGGTWTGGTGKLLHTRATANASTYYHIYCDSDFDDGGDVVFTVRGDGAVSKASGSFKIDHPLPEKKDTHHLVHSFVEGPKADLIYRGTVDLSGGYAQVDLDDAAKMTEGTFEALTRGHQCWIQNDTGWSAVRGDVEGNTLTVECEASDSDDTVSWMVVAERCDSHMMETDWTDDDGHVIVEPEKPEEEE